MALPAVAAAAARAAPKIAKFLKKGKGLPLPAGEEKEKPSILSVEGIVMLLLAGLVEIANIILAVLDLAGGMGTALAPIVNGVATVFIGGWLFFRTGKLPIKKALLPLGLNSLPLLRFFPFWLWSVWSSCKKSL